MASLVPTAASSPAGAASRSKKRPASPGTGGGAAKKKKATVPGGSQVSAACSCCLHHASFGSSPDLFLLTEVSSQDLPNIPPILEAALPSAALVNWTDSQESLTAVGCSTKKRHN